MSVMDFKEDESAAVTVDLVVITAAIVAIALASFALISRGIHIHLFFENERVSSENVDRAIFRQALGLLR